MQYEPNPEFWDKTSTGSYVIKKTVDVHIKYVKCGHEVWIKSPGIADPVGIYAELSKCPTDDKVYVADFDNCSNCKGK